MATPSLAISIRHSPLRRGFLLLFLGLSFVLLPTTRAVNPTPDGGYANGNAAEGRNALYGLTSGFVNTAIEDSALYGDTTGGGNTAVGNQEQAATITGLKSAAAQQQKDIATLTAALKAQAAQIQKVTDQLKTQAPASHVVVNH